ncbi:molybdopterin-dependent oxidoreductase [Desulfobacterales bacterium HSG2]|nr:molybdopterin-dependent oxidoreductase [Desulfobacterales bacterium HSG2]
MTNKIHWIKTHCARMDHGGCGLLVGVKDNRIVEVKGDPDGFLNRGYVCPKALASPDRLTHPARLRHPLKRSGKRGEGKWERISWSEAIQTICENLSGIKEEYGAKAVAFCQGMPKGLEHFVLIRLANIFGSPNVVAVQDVCHAPREVSGIHTCGFYPVADFHHQSRLVVLWGSNITSTNEEGEICSLLLNQIKSGTDLIVIDPKKRDLAGKSEYFLQIKPGTDNALALAFLNVIIEENLYDREFVENRTYGFEELAAHVRNYTPEKMSEVTRVPADLIRKAARCYASSHPAAIQWGNPIEQNINTFDAVRAILCLMAICGNLDVPGGNIQANEPDILGLGQFVRADRIPSKRKEMIHACRRTIPRLMTVPPAFFKEAVLKGVPYPVRGAYMQCANPLMSYADSRGTFDALMSLDFSAVSDIFMTPTASLADIVLPAATHFEFNDIGHYGLGHGYVLARPKAVDPPDECWPDMKILNELGKRLTPGEYWYENYEDFLKLLLEPSGLSYEQFAEQGYLKGADRFQKYLSSGFRTPTGKVELRLSRAEKFHLPPLPEFTGPPEANDPDFPLILTSAKDRYYLHSSYRWIEKLRKRSPRPVTEIHPETAAACNIREGDEVVIETRHGSITQFARVTDRVQPGVVYAAYGWWFPEGKGEMQYEWEKSNYNLLTSAETLGREFGTPNLKGLGCRIRRLTVDG